MKTATLRPRRKSKTRAPQNGRRKPAPEVMTCDEVERLYDGRWVIMDIRKLSRWNQPEAGIVVFSAGSQKELLAFGKKLLKENPKRHYYFFYAGDPSLKGPAVIMGSTTDVPVAC
jgi:hypothetical protein